MHRFQSFRGGDSVGNRWLAIVELDLGWLASRRLLGQSMPDPLICLWVDRDWEIAIIETTHHQGPIMTEADILTCPFVHSIIVFTTYKPIAEDNRRSHDTISSPEYFHDSVQAIKHVKLLNQMDEENGSCAT